MITEEDIINFEKAELEWQRKFAKEQLNYIEKINQWLWEKSKKSREELQNLFSDKEFIETYQFKNEMAYMFVIMDIYGIECIYNVIPCILEHGKNMEQLYEYITALKFLLWRLEFDKDGDITYKIEDFISFHKTSIYTIQYLINIASIDKINVSLKFSEICCKFQRLRYAFLILQYVNELIPGNEKIVRRLAELCLQANNTKQAKIYMDQIRYKRTN